MKVFPKNQVQEIREYYHQYGFVAVTGILSDDALKNLKSAVDDAVGCNKLDYFYDREPDANLNQDIYESTPLVTECCRNSDILNITRELLGGDIELQHAKMTLKPLRQSGLGEFSWHQDYPFFPHSNFSLMACSVLLDGGNLDNSPITFLPGSHKLGVLDHYRADGSFAYECTELPEFDPQEPVPALGSPGTVLFHHCLVLHSSLPSNGSGRHRRHLVFQYRNKDNLQLAGFVRKCNGEALDDSPPAQYARFEIDGAIKLIGERRRLYDPYNKLR